MAFLAYYRRPVRNFYCSNGLECEYTAQRATYNMCMYVCKYTCCPLSVDFVKDTSETAKGDIQKDRETEGEREATDKQQQQQQQQWRLKT